MRTVEEIKADLKDCYACEQKECLFPIPTTCGKPQDASVIAYEAEMGKAIINLFGIDRLEAICNAEREGRCVVLPCEKSELDEMLNDLEAVGCADERETYTTGYRNGYRNGRVELLKYILGSADGTRKATEAALKERERDDRN